MLHNAHMDDSYPCVRVCRELKNESKRNTCGTCRVKIKEKHSGKVETPDKIMKYSIQSLFIFQKK